MVDYSVRIEGASFMRRSRIVALQALYQLHFYDEKKSITDILHELYDIYKEDFTNKDLTNIINIGFIENLITLTLDKQEQNLLIIKNYLHNNWKIADISPLLLIIIKLSSTEICTSNTDLAVIINEYIEITKIFGSSKEAKFVNNILQQIANKYRNE